MVMWAQRMAPAFGARIRRKNLLVPQGGFEPSTYRLRSDCSAVELLRRPERALYQTSIIPNPVDQLITVAPDLSSPRGAPIFQSRWLWVPAFAGTTAQRCDAGTTATAGSLRREQRAAAAPTAGRWRRRLGRGLALRLAVGAGIVGRVPQRDPRRRHRRHLACARLIRRRRRHCAARASPT